MTKEIVPPRETSGTSGASGELEVRLTHEQYDMYSAARVERDALKEQLARASQELASERKRREQMEEALSGLVEAVVKDSKENNSISGFTGARLADAKEALQTKVGESSTGREDTGEKA